MRNVQVLELLNEGRIEELKQMLRDEIYEEALKGNQTYGAKKRYVAMKKYFTYIKTGREILQHPCIVDFEGKPYTSFCNAHSLALTKEPCGTMRLCTEPDRYPDVTRLVNFRGVERVVNFRKIFAEAKSKGYRLKKSELSGDKYKFLLHFHGAYFKLGLIDATFAIIDDGEPATVFHVGDGRSPMTINTSVGVAVVMPMFVENEDGIDPDITIIEGE